jgi:hypothetical protein
MARIRTQEFPNQRGSWFSRTGFTDPGVIGVNDQNVDIWTCSDEVGRRSDHPLSITKNRRHITPMSGEKPLVTPGAIQRFSDWVPPPFYVDVSHLTIPGAPGSASQITAALARTNPTRPHVMLPVLLYELKDLPGMIRDIGRLKLFRQGGGKGKGPSASAASHYLSWQMGWAPLISDLTKLLSFQEQTDQRIGELRRVFSNGGLRRRLSMGNYSHSQSQGTSVVESRFSAGHTCQIFDHTVRQDWATARWKPALGTALPTDQAKLRRTARSLVLGFHGGAENVWEAIPWSWLIDWSLNVGTYLRATNNQQLFHAAPVNYMRHTTTTRTYNPVSTASWVGGGSATVIRETKERFIGSATLTARLPFLNGRQLSILGALAIQRSR